MIKDIFSHISFKFRSFSFKKNRKTKADLNESFGKLKEDDLFEFKLIKKYFNKKKDHSNAYQILTDKTCNDLDLDETFMFIDRTSSRVGQQYLYNKLRTLSVNSNQSSLDEQIIDELTKNPDLRILIQKRLEKLKNKNAYYITTLFQEEHITPPKWFFLVKLLSLSSLVTLIVSIFIPSFFILLLGLFCINFVIHYWNKNNLIQYVGSIPQLLVLNNVAAHLFLIKSLKPLNMNLMKSIKIINEVKFRMSFFQLEAKFQGDFEIIAWFIFENIKTLFLLEPLLLFSVLKRLNNKRNEIEDVFKFVGHIDSLISIASLRKGLETYCLPKFNYENTDVIANEIKHPLIPNCQPNNIKISNKSILLTGSNMSGKTTFIRSVGLNIITGITLNTCFARSMTFPIMKIFSAIRISDDLMNDKSYYFEEVLTIKEMLIKSEENHFCLFLLDELFKGTNTVERISAGKSVLSKLSKNNNLVIVSTHDIELTELLKDEYELYHFSENITENTIDFDYKLKLGKLKNRNAIRILEMNAYPKDLINEAYEIAQKLDQSFIFNPAKIK